MSIRPLALVALAACGARAEPPPDMFTRLSEADLKKPGLIKAGAIQLAVLTGGRVVCYAPLVA
ncbi:MAG TPA: hypothetical protein VGO00_17100, partial [Kofleriaceae bacterium]|nr:hypothetical protein [Kofleriaceae bacterium]